MKVFLAAAIYVTIFSDFAARSSCRPSGQEGDPLAASSEIVIRIEVESRTLDPDRRCCAVGRLAARKGYTCMVNLAIAERKLNMAHNNKMKFHVHEKADYDFSREMRTCAKSEKSSAQFFRCCNKAEEAMREETESEAKMASVGADPTPTTSSNFERT